MKCMEIVIYEVREGKEPEFTKVYREIYNEMSLLPGFVSAESLQSTDKRNLHLDLWTWSDEESATAAHARFASLPHAASFMEVIEKVVFSGHFTPALQH